LVSEFDVSGDHGRQPTEMQSRMHTDVPCFTTKICENWLKLYHMVYIIVILATGIIVFNLKYLFLKTYKLKDSHNVRENAETTKNKLLLYFLTHWQLAVPSCHAVVCRCVWRSSVENNCIIVAQHNTTLGGSATSSRIRRRRPFIIISIAMPTTTTAAALAAPTRHAHLVFGKNQFSIGKETSQSLTLNATPKNKNIGTDDMREKHSKNQCCRRQEKHNRNGLVTH